AAPLWSLAATWMTPVRPVGAGVELGVVVPFPSEPRVLSPQDHIVPAGPTIASVSVSALDTEVTPLRPGTATGLSDCPVGVPLPSSPEALLPQASRAPPAPIA